MYSLSSLVFRIGHYIYVLINKKINEWKNYFLNYSLYIEANMSRYECTSTWRLGISKVKDCLKFPSFSVFRWLLLTGMFVWSMEKSNRCFSSSNVLAGVTTGVFSVLLTIRGESEECKVFLREAPGTSGRVARSSHPPHGGRTAI